MPIGITKEGRWPTAERAENLLQGKLVIEPRHLRAGDLETTPAAAVLLHGTFGKDGTIQGLPRTPRSSLCWRRGSRLGSGHRQGHHEIVVPSRRDSDREACDDFAQRLGKRTTKNQNLIESKLKYPVIVTPANFGSSVGISKAHNCKELSPAIEEAAKFDRKIVIERGVGGKKQKACEIGCSVLLYA